MTTIKTIKTLTVLAIAAAALALTAGSSQAGGGRQGAVQAPKQDSVGGYRSYGYGYSRYGYGRRY